jgi:Myb-like DNA-binding domain
LKIYGKDWKRVEDYVQTRSGAQIRSHAQKYFIRIQKKLKGNSGMYLNQTEDQCNTNKGFELFRQTIAMYEDGVKDDANEEEEEELSCMSNLKRQKIMHDSHNMFMRA